MIDETFEMSEEIVLPGQGETVAIPLGSLKAAALCYDRIWHPYDRKVPRCIRCFGGTLSELNWVRFSNNQEELIGQFIDQLRSSFGSVGEGANAIEEGCKRLIAAIKDSFEPVAARAVLGLTQVCLEVFSNGVDLDGLRDILASLDERSLRDILAREEDSIVKTLVQNIKKMVLWPVCRIIAKSFSEEYKISAVPIYESEEKRRDEYGEGDKKAIVAALSNIGIVDENKVTWEHVKEFRADKEAKRKYRRFLHWLDKEMVGKSQAFVEDEISQRLEDYESALSKHGIKTVVGTIQEALDGKYLLGVSGVSGPLILGGHPIWGLLGAGLLIGGKIGVKLVQTEMDFDDVARGPNSEISWVYEIKKLGK